MSILPDNELDLEKLFLPAWAQEPSATKYAKYEGEDLEAKPGRRDERGRLRRPRREGGPGARREEKRPRRERRGPPSAEAGRARPGAAERPARRAEPRERREPPPPLPEVAVTLLPDEKGVESLARQIKMTGRAYPLFEIAQLILQRPERHEVAFSVKKNAEGQPVQPLFVCALDDTLWLSEDEAVGHVLRKHFGTFYQAERTATEPPKGKYTFVAQCGLSGVILGPPNHHDYQNQLRKLHAERFSRMPFEVYKSRVKIVRDEEVVKKWVEDQSWRTEYLCLNMPESLRLGNMEAVEKHFRENHKDNIIKPVESHRLNGAPARALRSSELARLVRSVWEDQRRFPLQIATALSQRFAVHGLQFFKVNKTVTHVSVARPHYLDLEATPVSDGVRRIVEYVNAHPKCSRRQLVEALAPSPAPQPSQVPAAQEPAPPKPEGAEPTPEQTAVIADLHWLIHQGHVIEFANGSLDTAKKPLPKPPKPEKKPVEKPGEALPQPEAVTAGEPNAAEPTGEVTPATLEGAAPDQAQPVEAATTGAEGKPALDTPPAEIATPPEGISNLEKEAAAAEVRPAEPPPAAPSEPPPAPSVAPAGSQS